MLFPVVVLLGLNGLLVGILNAYDHFTIPALSPLVWNFVILGFLIGEQPDPRAATSSSTPTRSASWSARPSSSRWRCPLLRRLGFRLAAQLRTSATRASARSCG